MNIKISKKQTLLTVFLLLISIFSLIFYIVTMAVGFSLPSNNNNGYVGFWDETSIATGSVAINGVGICCIVFAIIITAALIAYYLVTLKFKYHTNRFFKRFAIASYGLFLLAMILAFANKPSVYNIFPWFTPGATGEESYTFAGTTMIIFLSILAAIPITYAILSIIKCAKTLSAKSNDIQEVIESNEGNKKTVSK